ncbi:MAG: homoserine kinase [Ilumatobacteraceae bacterium]
MSRRVVIRVPASSANLGPGFDTLGMALTLDADIGIVDGAIPAGALLADPGHPASVAFVRGGGVGEVWVRSRIPSGRGLGFSGAMHVGGLAAAHVQRAGGVASTADERSSLLEVAAELEGHPDNAAASVYGGIVVAAAGRTVQVATPLDPAVLLWVPDNSTSTTASRARFGDTVRREDAVFNVGRVALLVAALAAGDVGALRDATDDRLHHPQRFAAAPRSAAAQAAALDGGAWCAWMSGSGPTVAAFCDPADAARLATRLPAGGRVMILRVEPRGVGVLD